jgi:hypothetical protein
MTIIAFIRKFLFSQKIVYRTSRKATIYFGLLIYGYLTNKYKEKKLTKDKTSDKTK